MKKIVATVVLMLVVVAGVVFVNSDVKNKDIIRIHIRANSNAVLDQEVKYLVKDSVVQALTPYVEKINNKEEMYSFLNQNTDWLARIANKRLAAEGFNYNAKVSLREEMFPSRNYGQLTLAEGMYDALIVELGEGVGNNWWCVIYPQFCFIDEDKLSKEGFSYKSKFSELLKKLSEDK